MVQDHSLRSFSSQTQTNRLPEDLMRKNVVFSLTILLALFLCVAPAAADSHGSTASSLKVEKAVMCKGVDQRVPLGIGNVFASDAEKIYCFTKITGATQDTMVTHKWYLNGDLKATVDLPVKSGSWRTWSYKQIDAADAGDGMVEVVSEDGAVLTSIIFFIQE
jgi:hypothetical protein